ncbi:hypothetical protein CsSME_00026320 [Camellia sinensis var. sinensis]
MASPSPKSQTHYLSPQSQSQSHPNPSLSISTTFSVYQPLYIVFNGPQYPILFRRFVAHHGRQVGRGGLIEELCNGFRLLMDGALLGLQELREDDLRGMLREGDLDGDGALNQMEFCVLMFKLSPELMEHSQFLLQEALQQELTDLYGCLVSFY